LVPLITLHDTPSPHTHTYITVGMTLLDRGSVRHKNLYLTTHKTHKKQIFLHPAAFEPTIPASERPQTARPLESAGYQFVILKRLMKQEGRES